MFNLKIRIKEATTSTVFYLHSPSKICVCSPAGEFRIKTTNFCSFLFRYAMLAPM